MCQNIHMPTSRTCFAYLGALFLGSALAMGCAPAASDDPASSEAAIEDEVGAAGLVEGTVEGDGVLLLVNDHGTTTSDLLISGAGLAPATAHAIVAHRTDASGKPRWFKTVAELDAIPGTTAETFTRLLAYARANAYLDEGVLGPPALAEIVIPDDMIGPISTDTVRIDAGFDGLSPSDALRIVRGRVPNDIHRENEQFLRDTIATTHRAFTLGVNNLFVKSAPFGSWLRGLGADKITLLGTMSALHPTVLVTEKAGVATYWFRSAQGYEPIEWATYHYPILMRAHVRLETDPEGPGVRVFYPACPLKVLEAPTGITVEEPPDL